MGMMSLRNITFALGAISTVSAVRLTSTTIFDDAGDWVSGAVDDVSDWTEGAANDIGDWTVGAGRCWKTARLGAWQNLRRGHGCSDRRLLEKARSGSRRSCRRGWSSRCHAEPR